MSEIRRKKIQERMDNIIKSEKKRGTPQAQINKRLEFYKEQLKKLPKPLVKNKNNTSDKKKLTSGSVRKPTDRLKQVNINPPRANISSATSVRKPDQKLKQPNANKKSKEQNKNKESEGFSFFTPKGRKLLNRIKKLIGPDKTATTQDIKKALPNDGTYTAKQIKSLKEALKIRSPGHPSNRAKTPVAVKKVKPVVKTKVKPVVKPKVKLTQSEKILKAQPKPTVKPSKAPTDKDQEEINKNVKADPRITAKLKAKPKSKVTAAEQKAADSFPQGMGRSLSKQEKAFADSRGGIKKFAPGKIEKGLATLGGGKMRGAVTALEDTFYSDIRDRMDKDGGEVSEYEKNYVKNFNTITNRKAKGGMVKRNMGGPAKPRKKTVFRRGGGQALRGFGKATYSNKMY